MLVLVVPGEPVAKGRPRTVRIGGGVRTYTPKTTADYEGLVAMLANAEWEGPPMEGPLELRVRFFFSRPKRLMRKKDPRGPIYMDRGKDVDNLLKSLCDGLQKSGALHDDRQIASVFAAKWYAAKGAEPQTTVELYELHPTP